MATERITEKDLQNMPTVLRDKLVAYLEHKIAAETKAVQDNSFRFTFEGKEVYKSACLEASGQVLAYENVLKLFK